MSALSPYWSDFNHQKNDINAHIDKDGFHVRIDVPNFKPEEISVKTVNDTIFISAKHEEKQGEGQYIKREVSRQFNLPRGCKAEDVVSSLSTDGVLSVKCALPAIESASGHQSSIQQSVQPIFGQPHHSVNGFNNQTSTISSLSPYWDGFNHQRGDMANVDKDGFHVRIDVPNFKPEEISVKTVNDTIFIAAKHEEKQGEGQYIKREVSRQFNLPTGFKAEDVVSSLSDGVLSVKCAPPAIKSTAGHQASIQQAVY